MGFFCKFFLFFFSGLLFRFLGSVHCLHGNTQSVFCKPIPFGQGIHHVVLWMDNILCQLRKTMVSKWRRISSIHSRVSGMWNPWSNLWLWFSVAPGTAQRLTAVLWNSKEPLRPPPPPPLLALRMDAQFFRPQICF